MSTPLTLARVPDLAEEEEPSVLDATTLRQAFGHYPSGVVAVGAHVGGQLVGIAASSFTSVSLDPPLVSVAVSRTSNTWPALREAGEIGVSVLADHHDVVCRQLAGPADQRFAGLRFAVSAGGAVLLRESVSTFTTVLHDEIEAGDHVIALLRIVAVDAGEGEHPLVFHRSAFAQLDRGDLDPSRLDGRINGQPVD